VKISICALAGASAPGYVIHMMQRRTNTGSSLAAYAADYRGVRYERARDAIYAADGHACVCCGATGDRVVLTLDHIIAHSAGGSDEPMNLVTMCLSCNSRRRDLTIEMFAALLCYERIMTPAQTRAYRARVRAASKRHGWITRARRSPARTAA